MTLEFRYQGIEGRALLSLGTILLSLSLSLSPPSHSLSDTPTHSIGCYLLSRTLVSCKSRYVVTLSTSEYMIVGGSSAGRIETLLKDGRGRGSHLHDAWPGLASGAEPGFFCLALTGRGLVLASQMGNE